MLCSRQRDNIESESGVTMTEEKMKNVVQDREKIDRLIDGLTLFDDDLMSRVFDKNIEATELILRIILGRKSSVDISHILGNLITVIFDYQILRKPLKILSL